MQYAVVLRARTKTKKFMHFQVNIFHEELLTTEEVMDDNDDIVPSVIDTFEYSSSDELKWTPKEAGKHIYQVQMQERGNGTLFMSEMIIPLLFIILT